MSTETYERILSTLKLSGAPKEDVQSFKQMYRRYLRMEGANMAYSCAIDQGVVVNLYGMQPKEQDNG